MNKLKNKIAIVTGGASGIGKAIALRLAREGARVIITDFQEDLGRESAKEAVCDFLPQDVTNEEQWSNVIRWVKKRYGALDVLVNNAGVLGPMNKASPENTQLLDWRKIFAVNVEGVFLGCHAAIPLLKESGGGSIINISSIAGLVASPYATAYGASKAAVRHLTKSIAQHCAETHSRIRCNSVHPGIVLTPMTESSYGAMAKEQCIDKEYFLNKIRSYIPQGEFIQPQDIASAVLYLASDDARYVTGTKLIVDGGYTNCETFVQDSLSTH